MAKRGDDYGKGQTDSTISLDALPVAVTHNANLT
jgi:hypothetical protein